MIDHERAESEFGDLLFSLINYARFININRMRWKRPIVSLLSVSISGEQSQRERPAVTRYLALAEMDVFWNEAKKLK